MLTRRQFVVGGAAVVTATVAGGAGSLALWDSATQPEDPTAAWEGTRGADRLVLAGTLAANSHNTQPWRFRVSDDSIELIGDTKRTMGKADPRLRELHLSLGCALENVSIAAAEAGTPVSIEQVPGAPSEHFARLRFGGDVTGEHARLAAAIPRRRTNRAPYDIERPVSSDALAELAALADNKVRVVWLTARNDRAALTDLTVKATAEHLDDAAMQRDSQRWYRMRRSDAEEQRDGITVASANLPGVATLMLGVFPPTPKSFDEGWVKATRETHCGTAPAFGLIVVEHASDRGAWVHAGRVYQRMQLAATLEGIAMHPISQALALRDREVAGGAPGRFSAGLETLAGPGEVVLAFRIGYPLRPQQPSLRRAPAVERA